MGPLTRVRSNDQDLITRGLDQLLQHAVQYLCDAIGEGEAATQDLPNGAALRSMRNWVAAMLHKMPVTCQTLCATARTDPRYTPVLFYERTRLGVALSGHFLEGLAPGLSLFSGHTAVSLLDSDLQKLRLRDVVADRIKTVASLEQFFNTSPKYITMASEYMLSDVPADLPGRIHMFISRMRAISQGLRRVKPSSHFSQCKNCACGRLFYCGSPLELPSMQPSAPPRSPVGLECYRSMASGASGFGSTASHDQSSFCTWACLKEWRWQLQCALPDCSDAAFATDVGCKKKGRGRLAEALNMVSKRNERAGRHLRSIEKQQRRFPSVGSAEMGRQRAQITKMLNVDLGILYVSRLLCEHKGLSENKVLAGATEGWRSRPAFYAKAIREVALIYDKSHKKSTIIGSLMTHEPFLSKLKQRAKYLF